VILRGKEKDKLKGDKGGKWKKRLRLFGEYGSIHGLLGSGGAKRDYMEGVGCCCGRVLVCVKASRKKNDTPHLAFEMRFEEDKRNESLTQTFLTQTFLAGQKSSPSKSRPFTIRYL
jgi:hypothetical protein